MYVAVMNVAKMGGGMWRRERRSCGRSWWSWTRGGKGDGAGSREEGQHENDEGGDENGGEKATAKL